MGKGTVKLGRRGLPTDRPLRPLPERGEERESWVDLKGSGPPPTPQRRQRADRGHRAHVVDDDPRPCPDAGDVQRLAVKLVHSPYPRGPRFVLTLPQSPPFALLVLIFPDPGGVPAFGNARS